MDVPCVDARGLFPQFCPRVFVLTKCGRSAIEDELESLYDAYYAELEAYASHQAAHLNAPHAHPPPPGPGPFPGSVETNILPAPPTNAANATKKASVVKPTRDHKNVRLPASRNKKTSTTTNNAANNGPAHGEPGHTHSANCPHHPHNHHNHATSKKGEKDKAKLEEDEYESEEEYESEYESEEGDEDDEDVRVLSCLFRDWRDAD